MSELKFVFLRSTYVRRPNTSPRVELFIQLLFLLVNRTNFFECRTKITFNCGLLLKKLKNIALPDIYSLFTFLLLKWNHIKLTVFIKTSGRI